MRANLASKRQRELAGQRANNRLKLMASPRMAWRGLELLDTARAVAEYDLPMRVLRLWWGYQP